MQERTFKMKGHTSKRVVGVDGDAIPMNLRHVSVVPSVLDLDLNPIAHGGHRQTEVLEAERTHQMIIPLTVGLFWWNHENQIFTFRVALDSLVQTIDDLSNPDLENKRAVVL